MEIPRSVKSEHIELLSMLDKAVREPGEVGAAAKVVSDHLLPHFHKEEEFALPQLGALTLSGDGVVDDPGKIVELSDRLREEIPVMLEEHARIAAALKELHELAEKAGKEEHIRFAHMLEQHAKMEEEVLYPTSLLIGSYIKQKMATKA
jgi:iron-sulfur cluster repair protein YtfE (RIC family)